MRYLGLISAALFVSLTLPALGQRGGHGGGGFGSFGGGSHGGFGGRSFSASSSGARAFGAAPRYSNGNLRGPGFSQGLYRGGAGNRWPYRPYPGRGFGPWYGNGYGYGNGFGYGAYLWPNVVGYPFGFADFDDFDDDTDDSSVAPQSAYPSPYPPGPYDSGPYAPPAQDYDQPPPAGAPYPGAYSNVPYAGAYPEVPYAGARPQEAPPARDSSQSPRPEFTANQYRPPYQGSSQQSSGGDQPVSPQPATTLVFNNGWPNLQVHNYIVTRTTLYVLDGGAQREIPLGEINVQATKKANRSAGVNFAPPVS